MNPRDISIDPYDYDLPDHLIARFPVEHRDHSRLMVYNRTMKTRTADRFDAIGQYLTTDDTLLINDTKVIPARLIFQKETGGQIEIFCLEPLYMGHQEAMAAQGSCRWKCLVGRAKSWKRGRLIKRLRTLKSSSIVLSAEKITETDGSYEILFSWTPEVLCFSEVLHLAGALPLPPYMGRPAEAADYERYQTVFANKDGSVAAPTAGLHFTPHLIAQLKKNNIQVQALTLHVGAGTFKPVSSHQMRDHLMHTEFFTVKKEVIEPWTRKENQRIIPVGTTSMRTIESLYWLGVKKLTRSIKPDDPVHIGQWEAYDLPQHIPVAESLNALMQDMEIRQSQVISGTTSLLIVPGYSFRIAQGLITNFHLPKSTLLLLVAAFIGDDWRRLYEYAILQHYRFLSYGDSMLLLP